jgi:uncharacterized membrane protein
MTPKRSALACLILALAGLGLSLWLTYIHVRVHTDPAYVSSCAFGGTLNCETVAASRYSVAMGLPISVIGAMFYLVVAAMAAVELRGSDGFSAAGYLVLASMAGAAVSLLLGIISAVIIQAICLVCLTVYAVNGALLFISIQRSRSSGGMMRVFKRQILELREDYWPLVYLLLAGVLLTIAGPGRGFPRYWELASWRAGMMLPHGADKAGHPWIGAESPGLVVHEYFDYECPGCRLSHKKLRAVIARHADRVRLVRHESPRAHCDPPRGEGPSTRCAVARGAHCAGKRGRYWEWNDAVIARPKKKGDYRNNDYEMDLAVRLGLDREGFEACMNDPATFRHVQQSSREAARAGVHVTPTYIVDGNKTSLEAVVKSIRQDSN